MTRQHSQRGFSLIELIIGLEFGLVIAFTTAPVVSALAAQYQLMSASGQLAFDIARTRMQAVGQNRYARIKILNETQYACEISTDGVTWSNRVTTSLPNGVTVTQTSAEIRFDRRGFATVNNSLTVNNRIHQVTAVTTSVVGQVTVGRPTNT